MFNGGDEAGNRGDKDNKVNHAGANCDLGASAHPADRHRNCGHCGVLLTNMTEVWCPPLWQVTHKAAADALEDSCRNFQIPTATTGEIAV
jgi:hypothetical protein